jgi:hypothetical protein
VPQAVRQPDDIREHGRPVQSQALPGCVPGQLEGDCRRAHADAGKPRRIGLN